MALFGSKSDHPMADIKMARQLMLEIPKNDALKALQEVTGWIESMRNDADMRLDDRFAALQLLDETARPHELKLTREYFASDAPSGVHENRLWTALNNYYDNMAETYHDVLVGCRTGAKGASAIKDARKIMAVRGIHAIMGRLKCAAVRYAPVGPENWSYLAEYYAHAEANRYLDEEFEFHSGQSANNSMRRRLAGALLWWGSGTGSLKPQQIHLSERMTAHLSPYLDMGLEPGTDCLYTFDLAEARPPARFNSDTAPQPNLRFVRLSKVQPRLEALLETLGKGMVPSEVNLGGTYTSEALLEATQRLATNWLSAPPTRRTVRRSVNVPMNVVQGYAGLIDQAFAGDSGEAAGEDWEAQDISATGFRCILPAGTGKWVKVGSLIGYRPQNVKNWGAGIVRRLRRTDDNTLDVGVEILATQVSSVNLREQGDSDYRLALWLARNGTDAGEASLLVTPGAFADNRTLQGRKDGQQFLLIPQKLAEKGDDYDLLRCRRMEQDASTEEAH